MVKINHWVFWGMLLLFCIAFIKHMLGFYGLWNLDKTIGWGPDVTSFLFWKSFLPIFSLLIFTGFYWLQKMRKASNGTVFPVLNWLLAAYLVFGPSAGFFLFILLMVLLWLTFVLSARSFEDL